MSGVDDILNYKRKEDEDYYAILGCSEDSTVDQITAEYKVRALQYHPDKNEGNKEAEEKFQKLKVDLAGADVDTDHILVRANIKYQKPPKTKEKRGKKEKRIIYSMEKLKEKRIIYAMEKLKDETIKNEFQRCINRNLATEGENVEVQWKNFERMMTEGAQVLSENKQSIRKSWFDDECNEVIQQREKARMRMLRSNTEESR
ncbi:DnaJ domain [Popillia japonica]|uniref:DnaJ domain n=1 Tax=Popillia japonica TaxID=7064 RepID=A0AAW1L8M7_POPJA